MIGVRGLAIAGVLAAGSVTSVAVAREARDGAAPGNGPVGVHITPLSQGTIGSSLRIDGAGIKIRTKGPKAMLVTAITVDPGGSFGWHSHPGPVLVAVSKGTLDVYEAGKHGCAHSSVSAGQAFMEGGGHVHLARNEGSEPVELNATFLAQPGTKEFLKTEPAACSV